MDNRDYYGKLLNVCKLLMDNRNDEAKHELDRLILTHLTVDNSNSELLCHIFATALLKRLDPQMLDQKNIYLQKFDIPQIVLFYRMAEAYPQVAMSHNIANQFLASKIEGKSKIALFDIGIGKGKQVESLLREISTGKHKLTKVNVIGLDPDPVNLEDSKAAMSALNAETDFDISFHGICNLFEKLSDDEIAQIRSLSNDNLFVNSAFAFHHIAHAIKDREYRTEIFRKIKSLDPVLFTLVEPNSDHDIDVITKRFHNSWNHFSVAFSVIDESSIDKESKFLIKRKFFGREITDMFAFGDYIRTERHETLASWVIRFGKSGFVPYDFRDIKIDLPDYCERYVGEGYVDLGYKSVPLVGVLAFQ